MAKHKYMVMRRTKKPIVIDTGRGRRKTWRENGGKADFFYVSSKSEADEIDQEYGTKGSGDVWVKEHGQAGHDATYHMDSGKYNTPHKYFWGASTQYSRAWEAFEKRRKDKSHRNVEAADEAEVMDGN